MIFVLLNMWASASSNVQGGFRLMVYDVNRRRAITIRPGEFQHARGTGERATLPAPAVSLRPIRQQQSADGQDHHRES